MFFINKRTAPFPSTLCDFVSGSNQTLVLVILEVILIQMHASDLDNYSFTQLKSENFHESLDSGVFSYSVIFPFTLVCVLCLSPPVWRVSVWYGCG